MVRILLHTREIDVAGRITVWHSACPRRSYLEGDPCPPVSKSENLLHPIGAIQPSGAHGIILINDKLFLSKRGIELNCLVHANGSPIIVNYKDISAGEIKIQQAESII
jgi:hypothetical protein